MGDVFDTLVKSAAGIAFPAAVAIFLLTRMEAAVDRLRDEITQLRLTIAANPPPRPPHQGE